MYELTTAEVREAICILRDLPRNRGQTPILTIKEQNALRKAALLYRKIQKRHDKNRTNTQGG